MSAVSEELSTFPARPALRRSRLRRTLATLRRSRPGMLGAAIVGVFVVMAIFGPLISPHDPDARNIRGRFQPPGYSDSRGTYVLGTDQLGRDTLSRIIKGSRVSLLVGITAVSISSVLGVLLGMIAGFAGGVVDTLIMRIVDAFLGIPFIILAIAVSGVIGAGLTTLILILGFTGWEIYARVVRAQVLVVRELDYIAAARVVGQSPVAIVLRHVLPNVMTVAIIQAALQVGVTILAESSLSFLGLGVQSPTVTWGAMLADGRQYLSSAWWMSTFPGLAITITVLGIVFLGDWLRDALDPRLKGQ